MIAAPLTETIGDALQSVAQLERQHHSSQQYEATLERLSAVETQVAGLAGALRRLRRSAALLRRVFREAGGQQRYRAVRRRLRETLPRPIYAPGSALIEGDQRLLDLMVFLGGARREVELQTAEVEASLIGRILASAGIRTLDRRRRAHRAATAYLERLADEPAPRLPGRVAELLEALGERPRPRGRRAAAR